MSAFEELPPNVLEHILLWLPPHCLQRVACCNNYLQSLCNSDALWYYIFAHHFPAGLEETLDAVAPCWWVHRSWRERFIALRGGASFACQVYHREINNVHELFVLSCYDASLRLSPKSLAGSASIYDYHTHYKPQGLHQPFFIARYPSMRGTAESPVVIEDGIPIFRLRAPPPGSDPRRVCPSNEALTIGTNVEVQWKARRRHPFGWWWARVAEIHPACDGKVEAVTVEFRQHATHSIWRKAKVPLLAAGERACPVNGNELLGYFGRMRVLSDVEVARWEAHLPYLRLLVEDNSDDDAASTGEEGVMNSVMEDLPIDTYPLVLSSSS